MKTAAIIGCGKPGVGAEGGKVGWGIAYAHARGYLQAFPDVLLHAVDPNAGNLAAFGDKHGIPADRRFASTDALYAAGVPDAASICTWPALHVPQAMDAARRGVKAITVEKPLGIDGFAIQELIDAARQAGSRVAVAHQRRYESWYVKTKELIAQGVLGDKLVIEARIEDDWDILSWTVHWFDMANFFFNDTPQWMLAGVDHRDERRYGHAVEHASVVLAQYPGDRQASFITGPAALPHGIGITIRGDRGMLVIADPIKLWTTDGYRDIHSEKPAESNSFFASLFTDLWGTIGTERVSTCGIEHCAAATQMAYAAHESARTRRRIELPLHTWFAPLEVIQHPVKRAAVADPPAMRVVLIADGHHQWPGVRMSGRDGLHEAIEALGHRVTLLDATKELPDDALHGADTVVLYHTQRPTHASHRAVLGPWFEAGRPVVVSHCGIGAYPDWPEFRRWIGRYWVWGGEALPPSRHPHVPCTIRVDAPQTFDVPWVEAWLPTDELYLGLGEASAVRTLATAISGEHEQAYAWQVIAHPNVVAWLPGHRRDMFALDAVRDGLAASLRLAHAGAKARVAVG